MIHVNICRSAKVNGISYGAEMLWIRILTLVDDNGNYDRDPLVVYANGVKHKKGVKLPQVVAWMDELVGVKLLEVYEYDGQEYIHFADFHEYQTLRADRHVAVEWPVHPHGDAFLESGIGKSVRRQTETSCQPIDNQLPVKCLSTDNQLTPIREVEVKDKVKEKTEEGSSSDFEPEDPTSEANYQNFIRSFKDAAGVKPKPFPTAIEKYQSLCRKYGEDEVLDSINAWVHKKGGKSITRKSEWAPKNFLEDAEDILDARIDAANEATSRSGELPKLEPVRR